MNGYLGEKRRPAAGSRRVVNFEDDEGE